MLREEGNICCQEQNLEAVAVEQLEEPPRLYSLPPWVPGSLSECVGFVDCMAALQIAIW